MKKIVLSIAAAATMSSLASAGGDITPVVTPSADVSGVYFGLGLSYAKQNWDYTDYTNRNDSVDGDYEFNAGMLQLGYQYNKYIGIEGRYTYNFNEVKIDDFSAELSSYNIGVYLKPQYTFGNVTAYALLGYGWTHFELGIDGDSIDDTHGGFQWGVGAAFALSEHTSVFVDYTQLADGVVPLEGEDGKFELDKYYTINVGMTYKF